MEVATTTRKYIIYNLLHQLSFLSEFGQIFVIILIMSLIPSKTVNLHLIGFLFLLTGAQQDRGRISCGRDGTDSRAFGADSSRSRAPDSGSSLWHSSLDQSQCGQCVQRLRSLGASLGPADLHADAPGASGARLGHRSVTVCVTVLFVHFSNPPSHLIEFNLVPHRCFTFD